MCYDAMQAFAESAHQVPKTWYAKVHSILLSKQREGYIAHHIMKETLIPTRPTSGHGHFTHMSVLAQAWGGGNGPALHLTILRSPQSFPQHLSNW